MYFDEVESDNIFLRTAYPDARLVVTKETMTVEGMIKIVYDLLKDKLNIVKNIIDELPEKQRSCLQLRDIEGKSYKEIADILCITEDQVKVNIFRARQTVKQRFQQFDRYGL